MSDQTLVITGVAQSNSLVAELMRNLDASHWLEAPVLIDVQAGPSPSEGRSACSNERAPNAACPHRRPVLMVAHWLARLSHFDLRDPNVERVSNGSFRLKAVVVLVLVSAVLVMGYALMLRAPLNQLAQQRDAEVMLHGEFVAKAAQVASLEAQLLSMHELEAAFSDVLKQLPGQAQVPGLLDDMSRLGQTSGLQIEAHSVVA
jgi:Tfp pilus assembly protein PilN